MIVFGAGGVAMIMAVAVLVVVIMLVVMAMIMPAIWSVNVALLAVRRVGVGRVIMMIMAMMIVPAIMPAMIIGAALGLEGTCHLGDRTALTADHLGEHVIVLDVKSISGDLGWGVAVADMPGDAHQAQRVLGPDFKQRFGCGVNGDEAAIIKLDRIALGNDGCLVEIEQKFHASHGFQHGAAALAVLVGEHDRAHDLVGLDGGFADDCGGALHGSDPLNACVNM